MSIVIGSALAVFLVCGAFAGVDALTVKRAKETAIPNAMLDTGQNLPQPQLADPSYARRVEQAPHEPSKAS